MAKGLKVFLLLLVTLIVASAIAVGVFFLYNYVDSAGQVKTFYVQYGSEEIAAEKHDLELPKGVWNVFNCKTLTNNAGYTVTIGPAPTVKLDYTVDGVSYGFGGLKDLSAAFGLVKGDSSFMLSWPEESTIETVLQALYADQEVVVPSVDLAEKDLFCLSVKSGDGLRTVNIFFH